jgi:outer membrane murein-binding lipoprotein Lpp
MPKYIAKQSIGQFMPGDEIKGLNEERIQALLASGAIEEYQEPEEPKADGTAAQLANLAAENAELKAKVEGLEKSLNASEAALKKATAEAKKAATPTDK